ncbi:MAG: sugar transferase [Thermodesulfobacteriota bacterium]
MFENRRVLYLSVISFLSHAIAIGSFLISVYYSHTNLEILPLDGVTYVPFGAIVSVAALACAIAIVNIIFIHYFYSYQHQFYLPRPKAQIANFLVMALADVFLAYFVQLCLPSKVLSMDFYPRFYAVAIFLNWVAAHGVHYIFKMVNARPRNRRNYLMIGTNKRAVQFSKFFERNSVLGFYNIGYLDDTNYSGEAINIIGTIDQFTDIIRNNVVDIVVVHLPIRSCYDQIVRIINISEVHGISVHYLTNIFDPKHSAVMTSKVGALASIIMHTAPLEDWRILIKRIFDIVFSSFAILFFSPLMLLVAMIIKIKDNDDIIYTQERVGYNKRIFKVYKFRTMCTDADKIQKDFSHLNEMDGPVFKIKNDPRVTPFGRFLRKYSIDELPQLFNVFKGDMSVVGPRPMALRDYEGFSEDWQRRRFSMRPGLTCYWQIRGRNKLPFQSWMRLDMEYIDNWSLLEDIKIIFLTIPEVLRGGGV